MEGERWDDFNVVVTRLSHPALIDLYTAKKIQYTYYLLKIDPGTAYSTFKNKGGNCTAIEAFQRYCLIKNGYKAVPLEVESRGAGTHAITKFWVPEIDGFFLMDNGNLFPKGILGPFRNMEESGYKLSRYKKNIY